MTRERERRQAAARIEALPRPEEELNAEQAEAVQGGLIAVALPGGTLSSSVAPSPPASTTAMVLGKGGGGSARGK